MNSYMNSMEFNRNEFNEIVMGGMPVNHILGEWNEMTASLQEGGGKRTKIESLEDLVVPIGLDSHSGCVFEPTRKRSDVGVIGDELFDLLFAQVTEKETKKMSRRKTQKNKI